MLPVFAEHPEFVAVCEHWRATGDCPDVFADWFRDKEGLFWPEAGRENSPAEAYAAGWRFLARGYDGSGGPKPHRVTESGLYAFNMSQVGNFWGASSTIGQREGVASLVAEFLEHWRSNGLSCQQLDAAEKLLTSPEQVRTCGGYAGPVRAV